MLAAIASAVLTNANRKPPALTATTFEAPLVSAAAAEAVAATENSLATAEEKSGTCEEKASEGGAGKDAAPDGDGGPSAAQPA